MSHQPGVAAARGRAARGRVEPHREEDPVASTSIFVVDRTRLAARRRLAHAPSSSACCRCSTAGATCARLIDDSGLLEFEVGKALYGLITAGFAAPARQDAGATRRRSRSDARVEEHRNLGRRVLQDGDAGRGGARVPARRGAPAAAIAQAHFFLGLVALRQGRWGDAVDALRHAAEQRRRPAGGAPQPRRGAGADRAGSRRRRRRSRRRPRAPRTTGGCMLGWGDRRAEAGPGRRRRSSGSTARAALAPGGDAAQRAVVLGALARRGAGGPRGGGAPDGGGGARAASRTARRSATTSPCCASAAASWTRAEQLLDRGPRGGAVAAAALQEPRRPALPQRPRPTRRSRRTSARSSSRRASATTCTSSWATSPIRERDASAAAATGGRRSALNPAHELRARQPRRRWSACPEARPPRRPGLASR